MSSVNVEFTPREAPLHAMKTYVVGTVNKAEIGVVDFVEMSDEIVLVHNSQEGSSRKALLQDAWARVFITD